MNEKNSTITTGFFKKPLFPKKLPSKKVLIRVLGFILLCGLVVGGVLFVKNISKPAIDHDKAYNEMVLKYQEYQTKNSPSIAIEAIDKYLATDPPDKEKRAKAELFLANVYVSLNDSVNARKFAEASLSNTQNPKYSTYLILAESAKATKDFVAAADYFQKAYDILEPQLDKNPMVRPIALSAQKNAELMRESSKNAQTQ